jgi:predicted PurR-regulated permease PerM
MPLALAMYLAFLLTPLVRTFQRWGLSRIPAVVAVTLFAGVVLTGFGWAIGEECSRFVNRLPDYADALDKKIKSWQSGGEKFSRLNKVVGEILGNSQPPGQVPVSNQTDGEQPPTPVVVNSLESRWQTWLLAQIPSVLEILINAALVIVLMLFILLNREELRNRLIRLIGRGHVILTTRAVDEAGRRVSRYLVMQLIINAGFGLAAGIGLWLIGVELAPLWGVICGLLRYVPYIGAPIGFAFPILISFVSDGWLPPVLTLALYCVLELTVANVIEPLLFGHSIGVSAVALLATTVFWSLLWGPVGLVLACPLTVCLVILGKYVPRLNFLTVLLAEEPALSEDVTYYQRLSAHDMDEAVPLALEFRKRHSLQEVFDQLIVPALSYCRQDHFNDALTDQDQKVIFDSISTTLDVLAQDTRAQSKGMVPVVATNGSDDTAAKPGTTRAVRILAVPGQNQADELAIRMLRMLLDPAKWDVHATTDNALAAEVESLIAEEQPALVFLTAVVPGSLTHTRYLCKRLRAEYHDLPVVVAILGTAGKVNEPINRLKSLRATSVERSLKGLLTYLAAWRPPLLARQFAESAAH